MPYDPTYHWLARLDRIRAFVKREQPDVLEVHSPYLATLGAFVAGRTPVRTFWWHADPIDTYLAVAKLPLRLGAPLWRGLAAMLGRFDAVLAAGRTQVKKLLKHGVKTVFHIPFGVDKKVFHPRPRRPHLMPLLIGVGRFAVEKRWDVVLDAFARIKTEATLVLYGDGPERARLEAKAGPRVVFKGFEKDRGKLAAALADADLLVHGCPHETFGLGIAEAMACGTPVVVPDRGGACEAIDPASGMTYRSEDPAACAAAIETMLARDVREAARRAADKVWSVEDHFARVVEVYAELRARK
jgi:alpha-1,6-mannosyltransferase